MNKQTLKTHILPLLIISLTTHPHSPAVICLLVQQEGLHLLQEGDLHLFACQSWTNRPLLLALFPEKPTLFSLQQCPRSPTAQNCSQAGPGAGNGICSQRHAGDKCSIPINTCVKHLHSGRTPTRLSSSLDPEGKQRKRLSYIGKNQSTEVSMSQQDLSRRPKPHQE